MSLAGAFLLAASALAKNFLRSALAMVGLVIGVGAVVTMVALGGVYVLLGAYLIGALQIMVYAGAILVLFLFVVMLLNLRREEFSPQRQLATKIAAAVIGLLFLLQFLRLIDGAFGAPAAIPADFGGYRQVGTALFTDYVLAFEATSLLLLAAMVGAVILAKRRID